MKNLFVSVSLALPVVAATCMAQSTAATGVKEPYASSAPVAFVYVPTAKGIDLYNAASDGKLSLVKGSPFTTSGLAIASDGKYFISLGTNYIHVYKIAANGAIGDQVSELDTASYNGGKCGSTAGAVRHSARTAGQQQICL